MTENLSRAKGLVYGLAIRDALARMTEFISLKRIKSSYGQGDPEGDVLKYSNNWYLSEE